MTEISPKSPSFADLRSGIDAIDQDIHALLMRRAEVVTALGELKKQQGGPAAPLALRPGREAEILRRLAATHKGSLPLVALLGLWRSMMAGFLQMQTPFSVLVPQADRDVSFSPPDHSMLDLARSHFGAAIPINAAPDAAAIVNAIEGDATILGVLPPLAEGWWTCLPLEGDDRPRILAALPFWNATPQGFLVSRAAPEETGRDIALIMTRGRGADAAALVAAGVQAGLDDLGVTAYKASSDGPACHLLATRKAAAVTGALRTLAAAAEGEAGYIGLYAEPLSL